MRPGGHRQAAGLARGQVLSDGAERNRSPLAIIFFTVFIDLVGFGIVLPLLPYYAETYGATALQIGLLTASYSLMQFLFTPLWGRLSDRYGRRPLILLSLCGSSMGFLVFGLATHLYVLFAARTLAGIAGAVIPTTNAYIADVTRPEERARGMGLIGAAFGLGFILGPAIGGLLSPYGYDKPALLASAMAATNLVFAYFKLPESLTDEARRRARSRPLVLAMLRGALSQPRVALLLVLFFFVTFAFSNMEATFGLLNEHRYGLSARQTAYLFTYIGVLISVIQGVLVGRVVKRLGEGLCISLGTLMMVFGLSLMPAAPNVAVYCGILALIAFGTGINNPSITSLLSRSTSIDEQGGILGLAQSVGSLGRILGPMWGGFTFGLDMRWPFLTGGAFMALAFLLSLRNLRYAA
ncbi:MAG: tetracycline resistance MFS efflux pump [Acidobacteria bacterium]|nr:MAG: tetracycline resistance MFS efflux pump [Acidobacteriota bacterium]